MRTPPLRFERSVGTIVLLFVLSATSGAIAGAVTSSLVTPYRGSSISTSSTQPFPVTPTTTREPSLVPVEPRLAEPLLPPSFLTRRSSPVATLYKKARGVSFEERTLTDDRLLGQAVALTSDGWFVTAASVVGTHPISDLTVWHNGAAHPVVKGLTDRVNGTAYLKIDARDLTAPAFGEVDRLVPGSETWTERRAGSLAPSVVTALSENMGGSPVSSEIALRRLALAGSASTGDGGSPIWNARGALLGIVDSAPGKPLIAIPSSSIAASFSSLLSSGTIRHASLGVRSIDLAAWRIDGDRGALPTRGALLRDDRKLGRPAVARDSAAAKAGLKAGDVILSIERDMLDGSRDLGEILSEYRPDTPVLVRISRDGSELELSVTLGNIVTGEALK
jgi:S1-C subfamily serine protease